jgi:uncharacterized repeat protein (TIGR03806 family)
LHRLIRAPQQNEIAKFPSRLSDTGLFVSTRDHQLQPGPIAYSVIAAGWVDGAHVERFVAVPGDAQIEYKSSGGWNFPNGSVLGQTLALELESGNPTSRRRIETRLLVLQQGEWSGYSYRWNEGQSDATLVAARGDQSEFAIRDSAGSTRTRTQVWRYPSRAECMACHSRAANYVLGFTELQLNREHDYAATRDNQLRTLTHIGFFSGGPNKPLNDLRKLSDPYDSNQNLEARARSYLHVNCSVCHVEAGGGNAKMELGFSTRLERTHVFEARPQHDTLGIDNAMLIAPGDPGRSILYQRLARRGRGQMPPLVSMRVDEGALQLMREWIRGMTPSQVFVRDWNMEDLLPKLDQVKAGRSLEAGQKAFRQTGCSQCHRLEGEGGSVGPDLTGIGRRMNARDLLESIVLPSKIIADGYARTEIEMHSGEAITGRIEREDDRSLVIRPSDADELITLAKADVRKRTLSPTSNMPTGMLNTLNEAQVLDLLAWLISK